MVKYITLASLGIISFLSFLFPTKLAEILTLSRTIILSEVGWLLNLTMLFSVFIAVYFLINKRGSIVIPGKDRLSNMSWYSMCISTVIGSSLFVFGSYEPMMHIEAGYSITEALSRTMYDWGIAYITFAVATVSAAVAMSKGYYPFTPNMPNWLIIICKVLINVTTMFALISSITVAANSLSSYMASIGHDGIHPIMIIAMLLVISVISASSGVLKGVKYFSNMAMLFAGCIILTLVVFNGMDVIKMSVESLGLMLDSIISYATDTGVMSDQQHKDWLFWWPHFYAAWWFTYLPFSVAFFLKISQNRTLSEMIIGLGVIPMLFTCLMFGILGASSIIHGATTPYDMIDLSMPSISTGVSGLLFFSMILWVITTADSGSIALDVMTGTKKQNMWITLVAIMAIIFQFVPESWKSLQIMIVILGLPICMIYINMVIQAIRK